ncbi:CRTAC1 family protein [Pleionea litopenaei]|uniref:CRTAC1 family protein n=1 Tax=Pleionea litopenaei TaxID=3070815 RepID=A0AA51X6X4_9GAMM|nr:CRTAC1 family protein [Pleionea sp. HL-JVS1]WMS87296.1 CRTAC1 family protein [Pleionea sp. HL-JVS1]
MMTIKSKLTYISLAASLLASFPALTAQPVDTIINEIKELEKNRDPKCYATASRLENFMFGTPLTSDARFNKNLSQKEWARGVWKHASAIAKKQGKTEVSKDVLMQAIEENFKFSQGADGHWTVTFPKNREIRINQVDKRHYSTVAYALRAILAVQQEALLSGDSTLIPLTDDAVKEFKESLDFLSLSVLKVADTQARNDNQYEVSLNLFNDTWRALAGNKFEKINKPTIATNAPVSLALVKKIIAQKVASYKVYNNIANQLFVRNLQVYYARLTWPEGEQEGASFKNLFEKTMIQFAHDIYVGAEKIAIKNGHSVIQESDVSELMEVFIPHQIDEYEDAVFFYHLPRDEQIKLEAYDMDSFRDSGIHWRYLEYVIDNPSFVSYRQPDPFALELIVENIAQFGVLSLRVAGMVGKEKGAERLSESLYIEGLKRIQSKINKHVATTPEQIKTNQLASATEAKTSVNSSGKMFTDVSSQMGVDHLHRSADWLNRLLRSYLKKTDEVGVITIPPAFGGSGVAAEDLNNDGYMDLLVLSGMGNKLYLNREGKRFEDVTESAGLNWIREEDNLPGEVRQPIIADLNNDGLQDIVITYVNDKHRVYQNLGNETFKDVTNIASLGGVGLIGGPATVADFDNDGLLDIYVTYFGHYTKGILPTLKRRNDNGLPNQLFKNIGGFKFKNVTAGSGTDNTGWTQAVGHTDFNRDGLQDIIVGNDFGVNAYLQNMGNMKFKDVSSDIGTDKPSYTMNIGIADLNADLYPDIYISNIVTMNKDEKYVLPNEDTTMKFNAEKLANMRVVEANDLFLSGSNTKGELQYQLSDAVGRGYSSTGWSWDADFFDFDNDGDNDLYVLNGMNEFNIYSSRNPYYQDPNDKAMKDILMPVSDKESNVFFINQGGRLLNQSKLSGLDLLGNSRSAAYLDFDNDGDLDIAMNNFHEKANFFVNNLSRPEHNWLKIKLEGDPSKGVSRDAVGATILVYTESDQIIWREVHSTIGYLSVHPKEQHVGLGAAQVKKIEVLWPNGSKQEFSGLKVNKQYLLKQSGQALEFAKK